MGNGTLYPVGWAVYGFMNGKPDACVSAVFDHRKEARAEKRKLEERLYTGPCCRPGDGELKVVRCYVESEQ